MSAAETQQKPKKSILPILISAVLAVGGLGAGAAYYFTQHANSGDVTKEEVVKPIVVETPIYVKIAPFTVNIKSDDNRPRLLYSGISFKVGNAETEKLLTEHMTELRSRLLLLVAESSAQVLVTPEGKLDLNYRILGMFEKPFATPQPELEVNEVLFTDFIVQ
jgi:flagellar protein FliL